MKINNEVSELVSISVLCSSLSHLLRTPLGTALGVISDLCKGLRLDRQDLNDGLQAVNQIREALDLLREIGSCTQGCNKQFREEIDIRESLQRLQSYFSHRGICLDFQCSDLCFSLESVSNLLDSFLRVFCLCLSLSGFIPNQQLSIHVSAESGELRFIFVLPKQSNSQVFNALFQDRFLIAGYDSLSIGMTFLIPALRELRGRYEFVESNDKLQLAFVFSVIPL